MLKQFLQFFTVESLMKIYKVRDENGELDWEQVKASAVQAGMIIFSILIIWLTVSYFG